MKHFCVPRWQYYLFAGLMIIALFYHWEHVLTYAPFFFILLCPLMHLFHGHGNHNHEQKHTHSEQ